MGFVGRIAEYLGMARGSEKDAYEILLNSLGYILWRLERGSVDAPRVLESLGLDLPRDFVEMISSDVDNYIGRSSLEDLYRYQRASCWVYLLSEWVAMRVGAQAT
jgi:hypothetical protein